jgi:hypothetical protein
LLLAVKLFHPSSSVCLLSASPLCCSHQPVWADADQYFAEQEAEEEFKALEEANAAAAKRKVPPQQQQQQEGAAAADPMEVLEAAAGGS